MEEAAYSVIVSFQDSWLEKWLYIYFLGYHFFCFSSYYMILFYHPKENRSQYPFMLEQKQREFWNFTWNLKKTWGTDITGKCWENEPEYEKLGIIMLLRMFWRFQDSLCVFFLQQKRLASFFFYGK